MAAIIEVRGLGKTYEVGSEKIYALKNIDFVVQRGEFIAIMGQSGSGKSTLMNLLGCLDTPSEGTYFINGKEVSSLSEDELAAHPQQGDRLHFPGVPSSAPLHGAAQRRAAAHLQRRQESGAPGNRPPGPAVGGAVRPHGPQAQRAFGRPAAAGGHRPRPGEQALADPGRRADRQPRFQDRRGDRRHIPRAAPPGQHHHHGHPQPGAGRPDPAHILPEGRRDREGRKKGRTA